MIDDKKQDAIELRAMGTGFVAMDVVEGLEATFASAGGSCGNVMALLSWLGWASFPVARLGCDEPGDFVVHDLQFDGVNTDFVWQEHSVSTPVVVQKFKVDSEGHRSHRYVLTCPDCGGWLPRFRSTTIRQIQPVLDSDCVPDIFFFDRVSPSALKLASWVRESGGLVLFEPSSIGDESQFQKAIDVCHVLKFAEDRLGHINEIRDLTGPNLIIQTLGPRGLEFRLGWNWFELDAFEAPYFLDAAGSGDWCTALLLSELGNQGSLNPVSWKPRLISDALRKGQAAAALNCGFEGARGAMQAADKDAFMLAVSDLMAGKEASVERLTEGKAEPRVNLCSLCKIVPFSTGTDAETA